MTDAKTSKTSAEDEKTRSQESLLHAARTVGPVFNCLQALGVLVPPEFFGTYFFAMISPTYRMKLPLRRTGLHGTASNRLLGSYVSALFWVRYSMQRSHVQLDLGNQLLRGSGQDTKACTGDRSLSARFLASIVLLEWYFERS